MVEIFQLEGHDFRWRATGNDGWISIVVWPTTNDDSRAVASIDDHYDMKKIGEGQYSSQHQLVVTNRVVRELTLHGGVDVLLDNHGKLNVSRIEDFYDVKNAVRGYLD